MIAKTLKEALDADRKAPVNEVSIIEKIEGESSFSSAIGFEHEVKER